MLPPFELCQIQEQAQLALAAEASLPNVRLRAERAAAMWHLQGLDALKREQQRLGHILPEDDMSGPDPDEYVPAISKAGG